MTRKARGLFGILFGVAVTLATVLGVARTVYANGFDLWIGDSQEVTATGVVEGTGATSGTATVSVDDNNNIVVTLEDFV